jgi:toxin-antitoxin system PIN domain toxin
LIALPDVNVLVALAWVQHPHHDAAHAWLRRSGVDGWATCLLTQSGFIRLSMNSRIVGTVLDCRAVQGVLARIVAHPQHQFIADCPALTTDLFGDLAPLVSGYRQVTDAALLVIARAHSLKLVTFDRSIRALSAEENVEVLVAS